MAQSTCCGANAAPPVSVDYTPKGKSVQLNDLPVYTVGEGKEGLIFMFDIFGSGYKQIYQVADRLASAGFTVAIPDLFRGNGWSLAKFPPKPEDDFMGWLSREGTWEKCGADFRAVKEHLSSQGVTKVGTVGMCWGAKMALEANAEGMVAAAAICHPALFGAERALAERAQAPVAILPAGGDPMDELKEVLDKKPFASKCMYKRFDDQVHGFMAARGDWTKPEVASAASQGIELLKQFFTATLKA